MKIEKRSLDCYNDQNMWLEKKSYPRKELLQPSELKGIFVPTITPFKMKHGRIQLDVASHERQIKRLADPNMRMNGIFLASNAGQGRDMDMDNLKLSIFKGIKAARSVNKNIPVVVGALRESLSEVLEVVKYAEESGADAVVLAPGFTKGNIYDTLAAVSAYTKLPIIIYNNPGFQNKENLPIEFIREATKNKQVVGIKDTSGETGGPEYFDEIFRTLRSEKFHVMQGNTKAGLDESIRLADGMVPIQANLFTKTFADLVDQNQKYSRSDLEFVLDFIKRQKSEYSGTTVGVLKHYLFKEGVFETELNYPKKTN